VRFLHDLFKESETLREFVKTSGSQKTTQKEILNAIGDVSEITSNFLNTLIESGRYLTGFTADSPTCPRSSTSTSSTTRSSTRRRTSASSPPRSSTRPRGRESSTPSRRASRESASRSHTKLIRVYSADSRSTVAPPSWTAPLGPGSISSGPNSKPLSDRDIVKSIIG
jgi:hypothetical protein